MRIHVIPLTLILRVVGNACTLHYITVYLTSVSSSEGAYGYALCCRYYVTMTTTSIVPRRGLLVNHPDHLVYIHNFNGTPVCRSNRKIFKIHVAILLLLFTRIVYHMLI